MGNEPSIQYRDDFEKPRRAVLRSSSLRTNIRPENLLRGKKSSTPGNNSSTDLSEKKKGATGLKRSNTFTTFSTFSRPLLHPKSSSSSSAGDVKKFSKKFSFKRTNIKSHKEVTTKNKNDVIDSIIEETNETHDKDDLFIPRREQANICNTSSSDITEETTSLNEQTLVERNVRHVSSTGRITLSMNKPDEESKSHTITIKQNNPSSVFISDTNIKPLKVDSVLKRHSVQGEEEKQVSTSSQEDLKSNHSSVFEEAIEMNMERACTPDTSEGEEETRKHSTSAERRRKNILRSQSMNYHMNRPKLTNLQSQRSTSIDDGLSNVGTTKEDQLPEEEVTEKSLGGRRNSESSLLKEQHVKRSEQFSLMLKQYRQQHEKKTKLSSYGLGVISENTACEERESQRFRIRRRSDYIDAWLKDQNERIDVLSAALKGDPEKIRNLRASFRERPLIKPQKDLLPKRPNSVKLHRRKPNINNFISSSDSEDPDDTGSKTMKLVDKNGNFISKKHTKNPLKKQLTDTLLLVDNSFKSAKALTDRCSRHHVSKLPSSGNAITFSSTPIIPAMTNTPVAVVKPMQFTVPEETQEHIVHVNRVSRLNDFPVLDKPCVDAIFKDPVGDRLTDKELIKREEERKAEEVFARNIQRSMSVSTPPRSFSPRINRMTRSNSINSISDSLNKVLGDLKTLRDQDDDLAKQLLGLGKSIKDFKQEKISERSDSDE